MRAAGRASKVSLLLLALAGLAGCTRLPSGLEAVEDFDVERYLGRWYEIARLDHRFERGLIGVTATYSAREDGGVEVLNRGYDPSAGRWKEAKGKAYFTGPRNRGRLKVSFFGPFYGGYNIIALDREGYSWSIVCGWKRSYLWILSRRPQMEPSLRADLVGRAAAMGFDTEALIFMEEGPLPPEE